MTVLPTTLILLPLALGGLAPAPDAPPARAADDEKVAEYLKEIKSRRDRVDTLVLYQLAALKTEEALEGLQKAVGWLKDPEVLTTAYDNFWHYREDEALAPRALAFLEEEAVDGPRSEHRLAATQALRLFGDPALSAYERILREGREDECRQLAAEPLLRNLDKRGDLGLVELVLDFLAPEHMGRLHGVVRNYTSRDAVALFLGRLADKRAPDALRAVLLARLADEPGEDVTEALVAVLAKGSPELQYRALDALVARGEEAQIGHTLTKLLGSKDEAVRLAAIRAQSRVGLDDPRWHRKLFALARSRAAVDRNGAVTGLAELRTPEAIEKLYELLADEDWKVRSSALRHVTALRRTDAVPVLIERLEQEDGRLRWDLARSLQLLTGLDLGRTAGRWRQWWQAEGRTFQLPTPAEVQAIEKERAERRDEGASVGSFYGLPVFSQRVCFVLDTSGSMETEALVPGRSQSDKGGPTRLAVAKKQLSELLARIPEGDRCNMIFFDSDVRAWKDQVEALDEWTRAEALSFVRIQKPAGATNLFDAVELAFEDELVDTIYVLSDGSPNVGRITDLQAIRGEIERINSVRDVRIHCISVGQRSSLLRNLAEDSGGEYVEVGIP